jgi:hypothetical protein
MSEIAAKRVRKIPERCWEIEIEREREREKGEREREGGER